MKTLVRYQRRSGVATVTLCTGGIGNALSPEAVAQLDACIRTPAEDPECRAVVIESEGPKFCTGMDLTSAAGSDTQAMRQAPETFAGILLRICESPKPFLASVQGDVIAGGLGLTSACDIVIAASHVRMALTEAIVGMVPWLIAPFLLRRISPADFRYLALSTRHLNAPEAQARGLIDQIATSGEGTELRLQLDRLLHCSPRAMAKVKELVCRSGNPDLRGEVGTALGEFNAWMQEPELRQALADFSNGFAPPWFQKFRG